MDINVGKLIREVEKRQVLWDLSHKDHNNRFLLEKLWAEVASSVDASVRDVRQKWKYLRDQHRREVRKIADSAAEGIAVYEPTWKYFQSLCFLDSQVTQKVEKVQSGYNPEHVDVLNSSTRSDFWDEEGSSLFGDTTQSDGVPDLPGRKRKRTKTDLDEDLLAYLVRLERKKIELLLAQDEAEKKKKEDKNDDFYFMSSILPIMKSFTSIQKLRVRNKILKVLIEEMNDFHLHQNPESSEK